MPAARGIFDTVLFYSDVGTATKDWQLRIFSQASWFVDQALKDLAGNVDFRNDLGQINIPVGIFHGLHDQLAPIEAAEFAASNFPNATLVTLNNSGHAPFLEESQWFNEKLLAFLGAP